MHNRRHVTLALGAIAATVLLGTGAARAADYPSRPITMIVPFAPGGTADVIGRLFAQQLGKQLGTTIVVENKAGAGGSIGTRLVADAAPDGYTLLLASSSTHGSNPAVYKNLPYDPVTDFTPITQLLTVPGVLSVHAASVQARTLGELLADAKTHPNKYSYASSGAGGLGNLAMELLKHRTGAPILHIAYRGAGPAFNDVLAGQVSMIWEPLPASLPHIGSGRLRAIAIAAPRRSPELPDTPTFAEAGIKDYDVSAWNGLLAPKGLPPALAARLHEASVKALNDPALRKRLNDLGSTISATSPDAFRQIIQRDVAKWKEVAQFARISLD